MYGKSNAQPNQGVIDAIRCLQILATASGPVGTKWLSEHLGLEATKVNRVLKTLAYLGLVRQTRARKYTSGPGMHVLAAQSLHASGILRMALPVLEDLRRLQFTVALGVLWQDMVSYFYHASKDSTTGEAIGRVGVYPATRSGIGMALMAEWPDNAIRSIYGERDIPGFPDGIEALMGDIQAIRSRGFAYVYAYAKPAAHTLAVTAGTPAFCAVGISGDIREEQIGDYLATLRQAATAIEAAIVEHGKDATDRFSEALKMS